MSDKLIEFAKQHYQGFAGMPDLALQRMFEVYKETTLIYQHGSEIRGFAIYQEWPECLNFIAIVGIGDKIENLKAMLVGRHKLPNKKIVFFDEEKMELRTVCLRQQPVG